MKNLAGLIVLVSLCGCTSEESRQERHRADPAPSAASQPMLTAPNPAEKAPPLEPIVIVGKKDPAAPVETRSHAQARVPAPAAAPRAVPAEEWPSSGAPEPLSAAPETPARPESRLDFVTVLERAQALRADRHSTSLQRDRALSDYAREVNGSRATLEVLVRDVSGSGSVVVDGTTTAGKHGVTLRFDNSEDRAKLEHVKKGSYLLAEGCVRWTEGRDIPRIDSCTLR